MIWMLVPLTRMCEQIIKVWFDNGFNIVKRKVHGSLKGFPCIFQSKGHFSIRECTPRENKSSFMLVFWFDLDLIVARETIHKREYFTTRTCSYDLINKWCGVIVLRIGFVKVSKVRTNTTSPLLFINRDWVGHPLSQGNGIYKTCFQ